MITSAQDPHVEDLELVVATPTQLVTIPLRGPLLLGSSPDAHVRCPELASHHAVVEWLTGESVLVHALAAGPVAMTMQGRATKYAILTLSGPPVELGTMVLRLSRLAQTPPAASELEAWQSSVVDTRRLTVVREPGNESVGRVFQALHSVGSLAREATAPSALLGPAARVLIESTLSHQAGVLWRPDPHGPWTRALRATGRRVEEVEVDPALVERVVRTGKTYATTSDHGPRAYLPLRAPSSDESSGVMFLGRGPGSPAFTAYDLELATLVGRNIVITLDRAQALEQLKAQAQELEASHRRLSAILDAISEGMIVMRQDGSIDLVNEVARSLFEHPDPAESAVLRTFSIADLVAGAFDGAPTTRRDVTTPGGQTFEVSTSPVAAGGRGASTEAVVVLRDVTEERERGKAAQESERLRMLGEALATVAHELNNPLTAVVGFSTLVSESAPGVLRQQCRRIREQAERCLTIVRGLLTVARGDRQLSHAAGDQREVVDAAVESFRPEPCREQITLSVAGRPLHVFLADDEEPVRAVVVEYLTAQGHLVECAEDGHAALARLSRDTSFDVVLLDVHMPGLSGLEVLERLASSASPLLGRCHVVTGEVDDSILASARRLAVGVLRKPFTLDDLLRALP